MLLRWKAPEIIIIVMSVMLGLQRIMWEKLLTRNIARCDEGEKNDRDDNGKMLLAEVTSKK